MYKGTHNSCTGEKPANIFAKLFPFIAKCQNLTIDEQKEANVKLYDIRVKWYKCNYYAYHGLARYDITLDEILNKLNNNNSDSLIFVMITYEGNLDIVDAYEFSGFITAKFSKYQNLYLCNISIKKPKWTVIYSKYTPTVIQNYPKIVGWKQLIPFPKFWNLFKKDYSEKDCIVLEDFVK